MKKILLITAISCTIVSSKAQITNSFPKTGSAGIGTTKPDTSALLDLASKSKGLLIPRITQNQRYAIYKPATGLMIYQITDPKGFYYYNGDKWVLINAVSGLNKNIFIGLNAGKSNITGSSNIAIGKGSLQNNTNSSGLIAIGDSALFNNVAESNNFGLGRLALFSNTTGIFNTAIGNSVLNSNISGDENVGIGDSVLNANINGSDNTACGYGSLNVNTSGSQNTAIGSLSLSLNTEGGHNTAIGFYSMYNNVSGYNNVSAGFQSLYSNTTGKYNTSMGVASMLHNISGEYNTASGCDALYSNTTGYENTASGHAALYFNTDGNYNAAYGTNALYSNTKGDYNNAIGFNTLEHNTTGSYNTAIGYYALESSVSSFYNTAVGGDALVGNTTGESNTALGFDALFSNTTSSYNTAIGDDALASITTHGGNTAIGASAGDAYVSAGYNTFIGYDADASSADHDYSTAIGYGSRITGSNMVRIGNSSTSSIGGYKGWTVISDGKFKKNIEENVVGLNFINKLRPITYTLDIYAINSKIDLKDNAEEAKTIAQNEKKIYSGFIAQEVEKASKETGFNNDIVDAPKNENDFYGLRYAEFVVPLVKAVQELSAENDSLKKRLDKIERLLLDQSTTSIANSISSINSMNAYPNPVKNTLYIQSKQKASFSLLDATGKILITKQINGSGSMNVSKLAAGAYFLNNDVDSKVQTIVIEK